MQSKITIELDFDNGNEPILQVISRPTDDIRDKLISFFFERLGHSSSWCKVFCFQSSETGSQERFTKWRISPINPTQFKEEAEAMMEQWRVEQEYRSGVNSSAPTS